ncbi:hypothetical protein BAE44_0019602 [Dichanthelium oligosanthes]|uniref:DNA replication licensing factor MCM2-like winged-helix domain-containing protein n=1 Tax=Dichanthelium oligosanthes TaxID=888268 RepID=A0A1E5V2J7_9POAL|nr:hypothetical protein BAE44_0019602 [Dichanthelium oligosanthes]
MFLTDKYRSLLPPHHHHSDAAPPKPSSRRRQQLLTGKAARFDAALAARLRGLLPPPASSSSPLAALARLTDLLALTLAEAAPALAGEGDAAAVAAHLDAGVALLDACNAITARLERLRRRRLLARFALHLLASQPSTGRARAGAALADRDDRSSSASPPPPLPSLPFDQPRGRLSAAARVLVAVNAVSSLAGAAAAAVLREGFLDAIAFPRVSGGDFPWAEPFNAVSSHLSALAVSSASEVDAVDEAVEKLASVLDGKGGADEAAVRAAAQEVERRTEELTARLDRLSEAVNGVFRAALGLRNAELGSFMDALRFEEILSGSTARLTHVEVKVEDLKNKAQEYEIYGLKPFFSSVHFRDNSFILLDEGHGIIRHLLAA